MHNAEVFMARTRRFRFIAAAALLLGIPLQLRAEEERDLRPEKIKFYAEQFKLDPESRHMKRFMERREDDNAMVERWSAPKKIIKHIRGETGTAFPTEEQCHEYVRTHERDLMDPKQEAMMMDKLRKEQPFLPKLEIEDPDAVPNLPTCKSDYWERIPTEQGDPDRDMEVVYDMLWVPPSASLPSDFEVVFGLKTVVRPYYAKDPDAPTYAAAGLNITCLPTRIRATRAMAFRYEGASALKNYDKDPYGPGEMHPLMQELLDY